MFFRNTAVGLGAAALAISAGTASPAQAAYIVTLQQEGANVVATGSGAIDLFFLRSFSSVSRAVALIAASVADIITGPMDFALVHGYTGFNGPASFGTGGRLFGNSGSGDTVGIFSIGVPPLLVVPASYVSGQALSSSATWDNQTFSSLGVTPDTYVWTWGLEGLDAHADSFTLQIGSAQATPEPGAMTLMAVGLAGLGMALRLRRA